MTRRDWLYGFVILVMWVMWQADRGEAVKCREGLLDATKEVIRLQDELRLSDKYGMVQHEEVKRLMQEHTREKEAVPHG